MSDIKLNTATGDIDVINNQITLTSDIASLVVQRLTIRLNTFEGEWFYDSEVGVPYYQNIFGNRYNKSIIDSIMRREILETEDVIDLVEYNSSFNSSTRKLNLDFIVTTSQGNVNISI